jgi:hypothetical protein
VSFDSIVSAPVFCTEKTATFPPLTVFAPVAKSVGPAGSYAKLNHDAPSVPEANGEPAMAVGCPLAVSMENAEIVSLTLIVYSAATALALERAAGCEYACDCGIDEVTAGAEQAAIAASDADEAASCHKRCRCIPKSYEAGVPETSRPRVSSWRRLTGQAYNPEKMAR